jgi:hypothetical protein
MGAGIAASVRRRRNGAVSICQLYFQREKQSDREIVVRSVVFGNGAFSIAVIRRDVTSTRWPPASLGASLKAQVLDDRAGDPHQVGLPPAPCRFERGLQVELDRILRNTGSFSIGSEALTVQKRFDKT